MRMQCDCYDAQPLKTYLFRNRSPIEPRMAGAGMAGKVTTARTVAPMPHLSVVKSSGAYRGRTQPNKLRMKEAAARAAALYGTKASTRKISAAEDQLGTSRARRKERTDRVEGQHQAVGEDGDTDLRHDPVHLRLGSPSKQQNPDRKDEHSDLRKPSASSCFRLR